MINKETIIKILDNSNVKTIKLINIINTKNSTIKIGNIIKASIIKCKSNKIFKKNQIINALIIQTKKNFNRKNGINIKFNNTGAIILNNNNDIISNKIPIITIKELKKVDIININKVFKKTI